MTIIAGTVIPVYDNVLVTDMDFEEQKTASGIIIQNDDGKMEGIKPRWAKVHSVGPTQKYIKPNDWILVEHGRWTRGFKMANLINTFRRVDPTGIMCVADHKPNDLSFGLTMPDTAPQFDFKERLEV